MDKHFQVSPEIFDWVPVRALARSLKDVHRAVPRSLLHCFGCTEGRCPVGKWTFLRSEVLSTLDQVSIKVISVLCSVQLSFNPDHSPCTCHWKTSPPPCFTIGNLVDRCLVSFRHDPFRIEAKHFSLGFRQTSKSCFSQFESPLGAFLQNIHTVLSLSSAGGSFNLMMFIVNWETLYRQMCAFPNHAQSIEFTTDGHKSRCRNISMMTNRNWSHWAKFQCNNSYVNVIFQFFQKCRLMRGN